MTDRARVYGLALYELAREEGISETVLRELDVCVRLLDANPDYVTLLSAPTLTKEERRDNLGRAFDGRVHTYIVSFLKLLVDRDAVREFPGCVEAYRQSYYEDNGILEVTATTAVELSESARDRLLKKLDAVFGKKILLQCRVDPAVLGGMRLECAGKRWDGTVKDRLRRIEKGLRDTVL